MTRKTEKAKLQVQQELIDKDIIMIDLQNLYKMREKLLARSKTSYKNRLSGEKTKKSTYQSIMGAFSMSTNPKVTIQPNTADSTGSTSQLIRPSAHLAATKASTVDTRNNKHRTKRASSGKRSSSRKSEKEFENLGLSGATYEPLLKK